MLFKSEGIAHVCKMNMHMSIFIASEEIMSLRMRADEWVSVSLCMCFNLLAPYEIATGCNRLQSHFHQDKFTHLWELGLISHAFLSLNQNGCLKPNVKPHWFHSNTLHFSKHSYKWISSIYTYPHPKMPNSVFHTVLTEDPLSSVS